jgi:bacterioferritin-associated ferredoxin
MDKADSCHDCPRRFLCHCLRLTATAIQQALANQEVKTVRDITEHTGAGAGCTACHTALRQFVV